MDAVVSYIRRRRKKSPRDILVVYLPEFVVEHWWQRLLHRRTVRRLKQALLHEPGVMTATVPWAMHEDEVYDEIFDQRLQGKDCLLYTSYAASFEAYRPWFAGLYTQRAGKTTCAGRF